jgi:hypothetical protein
MPITDLVIAKKMRILAGVRQSSGLKIVELYKQFAQPSASIPPTPTSECCALSIASLRFKD